MKHTLLLTQDGKISWVRNNPFYFKPVGLSLMTQTSGAGMMHYSVRDPGFMCLIDLIGVTSILTYTYGPIWVLQVRS